MEVKKSTWAERGGRPLSSSSSGGTQQLHTAVLAAILGRKNTRYQHEPLGTSTSSRCPEHPQHFSPT